MWSKIMRKRSVWAKLPHTTFVVRARNYVTQRAENWNRFNSSSATFRFRLRSATLVANSGSAERSTTGSVSNRSAEGNGRPTSAARCRTRGATWRLFAQVDFRREIRPIAFVDPGAFLVPNPARSPTSFGRACCGSIVPETLREREELLHNHGSQARQLWSQSSWCLRARPQV